jgi:muramidase (phage lysozyme)
VNKNIAAFLRVIREGESSQFNDAYRMLYGGTLFDSFAAHPNRRITLNGITSTAAGAYQFLYRTWSELNLPDFSPENQDRGAILLIKRRKAYDDVVAGRLEDAIRKCNKEWASLPGSPYGQPVITMDRCKFIYENYGGTYGLQAEEVEASEEEVKETTTMNPFIPFALEALSSLIPAVKDLTGDDKKGRVAEVIVQVAKDAVGAVNEQELVASLKDPSNANAARTAVEARWFDILEAGGGGIAGARKAATEALDASQPVYKNPAFIVSMLILPLVYMTVGAVIFGEDWDSDIKAMTVAAVISGALGAITGYWLGTSFSSARKTELARK